MNFTLLSNCRLSTQMKPLKFQKYFLFILKAKKIFVMIKTPDVVSLYQQKIIGNQE